MPGRALAPRGQVYNVPTQCPVDPHSVAIWHSKRTFCRPDPPAGGNRSCHLVATLRRRIKNSVQGVLRICRWPESRYVGGMGRPLRIQHAGLAYHVMARGNDKMQILLDDLDYARQLQIYGEVIEEFQLDSWLYCLMPNHWHLVFRTRLPNLSAAMRQLNGRYAQWWNKRHGRVGHIFQGRFKGQIVEENTYPAALVPVHGDEPCSRTTRLPSVGVEVEQLRRAGRHGANLCRRSLSHRRDRSGRLPGHARAGAQGSSRRTPATTRWRSFSGRTVESSAAMRFAARFSRRARAASKEVPARERRLGTPPLTALLAESLQRGDGLARGVRDAHAALSEIGRDGRCEAAPKVVAENGAMGVVRLLGDMVPERTSLQS